MSKLWIVENSFETKEFVEKVYAFRQHKAKKLKVLKILNI